jgi:hypothetical protein|tara:strand:+ start:75 stop:221 length:147 start_codon:yes stop_codon:yes gene_type:complete
MDINLILLIPNSMILGYQHFEEEEGFDFKEVNLFLFFIQVQLRWGKNI